MMFFQLRVYVLTTHISSEVSSSFKENLALVSITVSSFHSTVGPTSTHASFVCCFKFWQLHWSRHKTKNTSPELFLMKNAWKFINNKKNTSFLSSLGHVIVSSLMYRCQFFASRSLVWMSKKCVFGSIDEN